MARDADKRRENEKNYKKNSKYQKSYTRKKEEREEPKWPSGSKDISEKNFKNKRDKKDYNKDRFEQDYDDFDGDKYNSNLIEGRNPVLEALKSGREIDKLFIQKGQTEGSIKQIIAIARDKNILIKEVDKGKLDRLSVTNSHQGVIASAAMFKYFEVDDILKIAKDKGEDPFVVILDEITDPQNLGSILRSCDGAGVHGVIIPKRRAASLTPIIGKISAGAVEHVPVSKVTNINQTIEYLKEKGLWIAGADMSGDVFYKKDLTGPLALVIGSEGKGLSRLVRENCDFIVSIPMMGKITSLNAAVSGAIIIFEIRKQRTEKTETSGIH